MSQRGVTRLLQKSQQKFLCLVDPLLTAGCEHSLHYCRVSWETTYGFITPLPVSYSAVSVCELGVMSVQTSRIFVCLPLTTPS
jgi:hypothetical protein